MFLNWRANAFLALYEDQQGILWLARKTDKFCDILMDAFLPLIISLLIIRCQFLLCLLIVKSTLGQRQHRSVIRYSFDEKVLPTRKYSRLIPEDTEAYTLRGFAEDADGNIWGYTHNAVLLYQTEFKRYNLKTIFSFSNLQFEPRSVFVWNRNR